MAFYSGHITKENEKEWENLVKASNSSGFHQSFDWAKFKQIQNWETYKIGIFSEKNDKLVGGCVVLEFGFNDGTNFLYIPEGPVLDYENEDNLFWQWRALETVLHSIVSISKNQKTTHIRIEPRIGQVPDWFLNGLSKAPVNLQPRHTQILNLEKSEDEILAGMKQKGRYNIRLAKKKEVEVKEFPLSEVKIFHKLYKTTFKRNNFEGKKITFFEDYIKACKGMTKLFIAKKGSKILAGAIIVYYGGRATYLYGASDNKNRDLMAPYALHWHIAMHAKVNGFKQYDFWGIAKDSKDTEHEWYGLTKFKKQFGGEQLDYIGAYDYVIQDDLYQKFVKKHES